MVSKETWEIIANQFGLRLNEEFRIANLFGQTGTGIFKFCEDGLQRCPSEDGKWEKADVQEKFLLHEQAFNIIPIPWRPQMRERYHFVDVSDKARVGDNVFLGDPRDANHISLGNCFKTEEEAVEMARKIQQLFTEEKERKKNNG